VFVVVCFFTGIFLKLVRVWPGLLIEPLGMIAASFRRQDAVTVALPAVS